MGLPLQALRQAATARAITHEPNPLLGPILPLLQGCREIRARLRDDTVFV